MILDLSVLTEQEVRDLYGLINREIAIRYKTAKDRTKLSNSSLQELKSLSEARYEIPGGHLRESTAPTDAEETASAMSDGEGVELNFCHTHQRPILECDDLDDCTFLIPAKTLANV